MNKEDKEVLKTLSNLLGKVDVWDNLMRIRNHQVAAELLEIALGYLSEK